MLGRILSILIPVTAAAIGQMILKIGMTQVGELKFSDGLINIFSRTFTNLYVLGGLAFLELMPYCGW